MPTTTENRKLGVQYDNTRAAFVPTSFNEEERTIEITFATETPYRRNSWDGSYDEVLSLKKSHVRMDRLAKGAPFLADHSGWAVKNVLGVIEKAWVDEQTKSGKALVRFSKRAEADAILADIKDGILRNVSVGYRVYKYEKEGEDKAPNEKSKTPPTYRATDWEPHEVSLVAIPADPNSQVRAAETGGENDCIIEFKTEERNMETNNPNTPPVTPPVLDEKALKEAADKAAKDAIETERKRGLEIRKAAKIAQLDETFADDVIGRGVTLDEARALIFEELSKRQAQQQPNTNAHHQANVTGEDNELRAMEAGMLHRAAPDQFKAEGKAQDFRNLSLLGIAAHCLKKKGIDASFLPPHELVKRAVSSSDFPMLTANIANKFLRRGYDEAPFGLWKKFATKTSLSDFKEKTGISYGGSFTFDQIPEGGEYQQTVAKESQEKIKLFTYGKMLALTRVAIINDDLGGFTRHAAMLGRGYAEKQDAIMWGLLTKNSGNGATMGDSNNLFDSTNHKNVGTTGVISETTISEIRKLMRRQTGMDANQILNLRPRFLVVPPELETTAQKFINGVIVPTATSGVNVFAGSMEIIVEPRLTDADRYYVLADPNQIDMLGWAELLGAEGLYLEMKDGFYTDGIEMKARGDFGGTVWDYRGFYKNEGA